jgi:hypothetical protein
VRAPQVFCGRLLLKQQGHALRLIDVVTGAQTTMDEDEFPTPYAQGERAPRQLWIVQRRHQ